ncbi:hypothetical protein EMIT0111MI5_50128 [Burkholderia sp. IT-111MI5]
MMHDFIKLYLTSKSLKVQPPTDRIQLTN